MLETETWISDNFQNYNETYKDKFNLDNVVQKELVDSFVQKVSTKPSEMSTIFIEKPSSGTAPSYPSARQFEF